MGFFDGLADTFGFGDGGAGDAANQLQAANFAASETRRRAFQQTERNLLDILEGPKTGPLDTRSDAERLLELTEQQGNNPQFAGRLRQFINAGGTDFQSGRGVPGFQDDDEFHVQFQSGAGELGARQGTTDPRGGLAGFQADVTGAARIGGPQGLDARLGEIFGSQNFQNLQDERLRAVQGQLAAGGLTRSGTALREIANVPTSLGFGIEAQQFGRQSGLFNQAIQQRTNIENLRQTQAGNQANLQLAQGRNEAESILGGRATQAAGVQNLFSTIGGGLTGLQKAGGFGKFIGGLA